MQMVTVKPGRGRGRMIHRVCRQELPKNVESYNWTQFVVTTSRFGYGYSLNTSTTKIAVIVLLLHAVVAICAIMALMVNKKASPSLSTIGETLALALNSKPPDELKNTGAGVNRLATWKTNFQLRVQGDGNFNWWPKLRKEAARQCITVQKPKRGMNSR
jgi:hypothetical protein